MLGFLVTIAPCFILLVLTLEFEWDLLERIKHSSKDWDLDNGKESGMTPSFDCVKSFMDIDVFRKILH